MPVMGWIPGRFQAQLAARMPDIDMRDDERTRTAGKIRQISKTAMCKGCDMAGSRSGNEQIVNQIRSVNHLDS